MKKYQVVGIGNAIVDVISAAEDSFLAKMGIEKGIMQLVEKDRGEVLYAAMHNRVQAPGGSVANTLAGLGNLGLTTAFIGRVHDDALGRFYAQQMAQGGTDFVNPPVVGGELPTSRSMIFVAPDGERSMNTYLGVTEFLEPSDIDPAMMADADWIYLEGYRFDGPDSHAAFAKAINACKGHGGRVSLTLSDPFCVERHRDAFRMMIREDVDLLFCNRAEILSMYRTDDFEAALAAAALEVEIVACTDSERGAHILSRGKRWDVPAIPTDIVDATGAGDLFAGAFLWGLTNGHDLETCGRMGCVAASEVISHIGARPEANLKALFAKHGLL